MSIVHPPILGTRLVAWPDEPACRATAARLAARPALRDACIELRGPLGAGKTTFVRHLLRALGVEGPVKSPTYAVMEPYDLPPPAGAAHAQASAAWHFDFYRFDDPQEWEDAGFRDIYASRGLKVAEWPDKAAGLLPRPDLRIDIAVGAGEGGAGMLPAGAAQGDAAASHADADADADADASSPAPPRRARFDALTPRGAELLP